MKEAVLQSRKALHRGSESDEILILVGCEYSGWLVSMRENGTRWSHRSQVDHAWPCRPRNLDAVLSVVESYRMD